MEKIKVGVFSDIHSNYFAIKACYDHAISEGASHFIFLGDYVSDLSEPQKTMELIYTINLNHPCYFVRGNRERYMLDCKEGKSSFAKDANSGSLFFTYERLTKKDFNFFASLPFYKIINIGGIDIEIAHSAIECDRLYFDQDDDYANTLCNTMKTKCFLTGHTHRQYIKGCGDKLIINPGSCGVPRDVGCHAQYALIEISDEIKCYPQTVAYPVESVILSQFKSGLIDYARYWAISVLYDVITGEQYTPTVLGRVLDIANGDISIINDESIWHDITVKLGMEHDCEGIVNFYHNKNKASLKY